MSETGPNQPLGIPGLEQALAGEIEHVREFPAIGAKFGAPSQPMHQALKERLDEQGIDRLFTHQAQAYDLVSQGKDIVVVTGTNSGKTLCYNLPAIQMCLTEPSVRILSIFPTKALAHDQELKLEQLAPANIRVGAYDGDTPKNRRTAIRGQAHFVLTNPDMLHVGILPGHENWSRFLKSLRLIVLDEIHSYRGAFGSHVACIVRRLLRLCEWRNNRPQIVACSATIGNPKELFEKITGREPEIVDCDGSPQGRRTFVFFNPPILSENARASANMASSEILATLCESGARTLVFNRARISAELVLRYARQRLADHGQVSESAIEGYRAGYTVKERRAIERALFDGKLLGLSATNAMELGVDIGKLDAVVMNGYPGTISSFWQQAGRAGRGSRDGLAVLVAHDDPLEQFIVRRPDAVLDVRSESVCLNPENPHILAQQLLCAAHERPIAPSELERFGGAAIEVAEQMDRSGELAFRAGRFFYPSFESPAARVGIRGSDGERVSLQVDNEELGAMDRWRALQSAHAGAIYLHRGTSYRCVSLDLDSKVARLVPENPPYYTRAMVQSVIEPGIVLREDTVGPVHFKLVGLSTTDSVLGFRKYSMDGDVAGPLEPLDLPSTTYDTIGVRVDLPPIEAMSADEVGGLHGLEHALTAVAPLLAGCDRNDLGNCWYTMFPDTLAPCVFVFDRAPGGIGLSEKLFEGLYRWLKSAYALVASCPCDDGCPSCLYSSRCESGNESLSKRGARQILQRLI